MKRAPLKRRTPLRRGGPLRRTRIRPRPVGTLPLNIRESVKARAGHICERCGRGPRTVPYFQVHHKRLKSQGGTDEIDNLAYLCAGGESGGCHTYVHDHRAEAIRDGWIITPIERNRLV